MKQETKKLIHWINTTLNNYKLILKESVGSTEAYDRERRKVISFFDSLPEIEEKLCFGGYIQDKNGTPCCHGDKIRVDDTCGELYWSQRDYCFYYKTGKALHKLYSRFEKVEK